MRLSVLAGDPGYALAAYFCRVFLDGVEVTDRCQTADEEAGTVRLVAQPPRVGPDDELVTEELTGEVRIELRQAEIGSR